MPRFVPNLAKDREEELRRVAKSLVAEGKGILAADESDSSMNKRLDMVKMENNSENRRKYRQMLLTAGNEMSEHIGGVILFDETVYQRADDGILFMKHLQKSCCIPGIKVDAGCVPLAGCDGESTTQGLDGLAERCQKYKTEGCHFAKWHSVLKIQQFTPSYEAMLENANVLARYASICQQNRIVPIVEPEILPDGNHDLCTAKYVTEEVLSFVFKALMDHHVYLEGMLLKPNMITPGAGCSKRALSYEIAAATVECLQRRVPASVPGIVFLSGGQPEDEATTNLNEMNKFQVRPWKMTFSFARALLTSATIVWQGKKENEKRAQKELLGLAKANGMASMGLYEAGVKKPAAAGQSTFIANNKY